MLSICNTYHYVIKLKRGYFHVVKRLHLMLYCRKCYNRFYILSSLWHAVCSLPGTPLDTGTIKKIIFDRRSTFAFFKLSKHRQFFSLQSSSVNTYTCWVIHSSIFSHCPTSIFAIIYSPKVRFAFRRSHVAYNSPSRLQNIAGNGSVLPYAEYWFVGFIYCSLLMKQKVNKDQTRNMIFILVYLYTATITKTQNLLKTETATTTRAIIRIKDT